jgi:hypothetical protein
MKSMNSKKPIQWIGVTLLGLTLASTAVFSPALRAQTITGTNSIALTDFDVNVPGWDYGYFYSWGWPPSGQYTNGTYLVDRFYDDSAHGGTLCMNYQFTTSPFHDLVTSDPGAGYGTGFGGPQMGWGYDPSVFNNLQATNYLFEFDARVDGLASGMTTANCEMQCQITGSGGSPSYLQKNLSFNPGSNWTHFSFTLDDGGFGNGTTWESFTNNFANIVEIRFNVNLHMPDPQFGWDDYNAVLLDNLRLDVRQFSGPPPPPPPTVPFTILDWNMDDKPLWYTFGGYNWSQNSFLPTFDYYHAPDLNSYGVGGSTAWWLSMDNSALGPPNTPQWAGGGTGGGGPVDFSQFTDNDPSRYIVSWDARVAGLAPDVTNTTVALQLFMDSPRGNVQINYAVPVESNWVHSAVSFNSGSWDTGGGHLPKASFSTNFNTYTALHLQWQIENAQAASWGYDTDNLIAVDNIKVTHVVVGCPPLRIFTATNNVIVTWAQPSSGTAKLLSGNTVSRVTNDVVGATSPYVIPIASAPKYFRTQWVP